ncbi:MAG: hypothetical protein KY457_02100 [Actinobacteria bacterium]|nr:hypothetical protein [Actinomycetota bacterium]
MSTIVAAPGASEAAFELESRWANRISWVWFAAAAMWALGDLVLLVADGRLAWDLLVVPLLAGVGLASRRASLRLDQDGFEVTEGLRRHRVLWASVERIEVDWSRRADAGVSVHVRRRARPLALQATWGLRPDERAALEDRLRAAAEAHGFPLTVHP